MSRTRVAAAVLALFAASLLALAYRTHFTSLWYPDACDYAQLGRHLARGEGFASTQTFPYVLSWLDAHGHSTQPPWPNVTRFVLPSLVKAASFSVFGASDFAAVLPDAALLVATVVLAFVLGSHLAGASAGWGAAVLVAASPTLVGYALSGLTETGAGFLVLAIAVVLAALVDAADAGSPRTTRLAALLGILFGLAFLQRSNLAAGFVASALALVVAVRSRPVVARLRPMMLAGLCAAVVAAPWMVRNALHFGSPAFSLTVDRALVQGLTEVDIFYGFDLVDASTALADHGHVALSRLLDGDWLASNWRRLLGAETVLVAPLLVASPLVRFAAAGRAIRVFLFGYLLLTWVSFAFVYREPRYFHPFIPLCVVVAVATASRLASSTAGRNGPRIVAAACSVLALSWAAGDSGLSVMTRSAELAQWDEWIRQSVPEGGVVASDQSWFVAWQGDRPSVRFYGDVDGLTKMRALVDVKAVWLTRGASRRFEKELAATAGDAQWTVARRDSGGSTLWTAR